MKTPKEKVLANFLNNKDAKCVDSYTAGVEDAEKREPLNDGDIADGCRANKNATHPDSFWAGVRYAEKKHGIEEADDDKFLLAQSKQPETLSDEDIRVIVNQLPTEVDLDTAIEFCRIIEKAHGIGGC